MNSIYFRWIVPTIIIMFLASPASAEVGKTVSEFENSKYFKASGFILLRIPEGPESPEKPYTYCYIKDEFYVIHIQTLKDGEAIWRKYLSCGWRLPCDKKAIHNEALPLIEPFLLEASGNIIPKERIAAWIDKIKQAESPYFEELYLSNLRIWLDLKGVANWDIGVERKLTEEEKNEVEELPQEVLELG